jgi:hypothetical protein
MIALKSMGHVAILQGSIAYACGQVLMIPHRVKGLCFVSFKLYGQAGCGLGPVAGFQLWMWGLTNDRRDDRDNSPLEEQIFGVILLVPLFTVSFY